MTVFTRAVWRFLRGDAEGRLHRVPLDAEAEELSKDATALLQVADDLYMHRRYRWQPVGL